MWIVSVEHAANEVAEHGVADEFKPLVIRFRMAFVGQSLLSQAEVAELIADTALQCSKVVGATHRRRHGLLVGPLL